MAELEVSAQAAAFDGQSRNSRLPDPAEWPALSALLDEALEIPEGARDAWLAQRQIPSVSLRSSLAALLAANREASGSKFLEGLPTAPRAPTRVGPWRLVCELGRGGMGSVWLGTATQDTPHRLVALKLPHPGLATKVFAERLAREREILAGLSHPNIARLLDAGVDAQGQPFLALEYIEGRPLIEYCEAEGLSLAARLKLFDQILAAVQYAHAHLVVHRDIKPSNVLVDTEGHARLLDFGIAKLLVGGQADATELTLYEGRPVSPDYTSPEQLAGLPLTTASDVYSLGVLLFELLVGERPYRLHGQAAATLLEALRAVQPGRPSAAAAGKQPYARRLRGDLDAIVLTAMRFDARQRYLTVQAMREDLQRLAEGKPVQARPDSAWYRARKFVQRHRWGVAAASGLVITLCAGIAATMWQAQRAEKEARTSLAVREFVLDLFRANTSTQTDPIRARETTARELLDVGAEKIGKSLNDAPEAKAELLQTLADLYGDLRLNEKASDLRRERIDLLRRTSHRDDQQLALALIELAEEEQATARAGESEALLAEAESLLDRAGDDHSRARAALLGARASASFRRDPALTLQYIRRAVEIRRHLPEDEDFVPDLLTLGGALMINGSHAEARRVLEEALQISLRRHPAQADLQRPQIYTYLGEAQVFLGDFGGAEESLRAAARAAREVGGESDLEAIRADQSLAIFLFDVGRSAEGLALAQSALRRVMATRTSEDPVVAAWIVVSNGSMLVRYGRIEEGLDLLFQYEPTQRRINAGTQTLARHLEAMATALAQLGRADEARTRIEDAVTLRRAITGEWSSGETGLRAQVLTLIAGERSRDARLLLEQVRASVATPAGRADFARWFEVALSEGQILLAEGEPEQAVHAFRDLARILDADPAHEYRPRELIAVLQGLGEALAQVDRCAEAMSPLRRAADLAPRTLDVASSPVAAALHGRLADCDAREGRMAEARRGLVLSEAALSSHRTLAAIYRRPSEEARARIATAERPQQAQRVAKEAAR